MWKVRKIVKIVKLGIIMKEIVKLGNGKIGNGKV